MGPLEILVVLAIVVLLVLAVRWLVLRLRGKKQHVKTILPAADT